MLMAAAIGDRRRFDKIWNWTKANLRRPDGLISFLWRDGHVVDPQAGVRRRPRCDPRAPGRAPAASTVRSTGDEALALGDAIMQGRGRSATFQGNPVLTAGPWAITPPPVTVEPELLLAGELPRAARCVEGSPLGRPRNERARDHEQADAGSRPAAARLGASRGRHAGSRSATRATRSHRRCSASMPFARWCGSPRIRTRPGGGSPPGHGRCSRSRTRPSCRSSTTSPDGRSATPCIPVVLVAAAGAADAPDIRPPATACWTRPRRSTGARRPTTARRGWRSAGSC